MSNLSIINFFYLKPVLRNPQDYIIYSLCCKKLNIKKKNKNLVSLVTCFWAVSFFFNFQRIQLAINIFFHFKLNTIS